MKKIINKINIAISLSLFLVLFYGLFYTYFFKKEVSADYPKLVNRFGTIMHHSSTGNTPHVYCYYPKAAANQKNEYILKRVDQLSDCQDNWLGTVVFFEEPEVSETHKMKWGNPGEEV